MTTWLQVLVPTLVLMVTAIIGIRVGNKCLEDIDKELKNLHGVVRAINVHISELLGFLEGNGTGDEQDGKVETDDNGHTR